MVCQNKTKQKVTKKKKQKTKAIITAEGNTAEMSYRQSCHRKYFFKH